MTIDYAKIASQVKIPQASMRKSITQPNQNDAFAIESLQPRGFWDWSKHIFNDARTFLSPIMWAEGLAGLVGGTAKTLGILGPAPLPSISKPNLVQRVSQAFWQAPTLPEMGRAMIDPYTSFQKYGDYWYEHPLFAALDISVLASGGNAVRKLAFGAMTGEAIQGLEKATAGLAAAQEAAKITPEFAPLRGALETAETQSRTYEIAQKIAAQPGPLMNNPVVDEISRAEYAAREAEVTLNEVSQWEFKPTKHNVTPAQEYTWLHKERARVFSNLERAQERVDRMKEVDMTLQGREVQSKLRGLERAKNRHATELAKLDELIGGLEQKFAPQRDMQVAALGAYEDAREYAGFMRNRYGEAFRAAPQKQIDAYADEISKLRAESDALTKELAQGIRDATAPQQKELTRAAIHAQEIFRGAGKPIPGEILQYGTAPEPGQLTGTMASLQNTKLGKPIYGIMRWMQRSPMQKWVTSITDWWQQQAGGFTEVEIRAMEKAMAGLTPEDTPVFRSVFLSASQFGYDPTSLMNLTAEGKIPIQVQQTLDVWNGIMSQRKTRFINRSILGKATQDIMGEREAMPNKVLGIEWDEKMQQFTAADFRKQMATNEEKRIAMAWEGIPEDLIHIPDPPDILSIREDTRYLNEFPELFNKEGANQWVDPAYYPHRYASDLAVSAWGDVAKAEDMRVTIANEKIAKKITAAQNKMNTGEIVEMPETQLTKSKPGFTKLSEGKLIKHGLYRTDVENVLRENIRRVNKFEGLWNIVTDVVDNYNERKPGGLFPNWQVGDAIPEGYRVVYPKGWKQWFEADFEKQVTQLVKEAKLGEGMLPAAEERAIQRSVIEQLVGSSHGQITGNPYDAKLIPIEAADHIRWHLGPMHPAIEVLTNPLGVRTFWTNFVLAFRPAWYVANDVTNALLTGWFGEWGGDQTVRKLGGAYAMGGGTAAVALTPELNLKNIFATGRSFGYSLETQEALKRSGLGWLNNINNILNNWAGARAIHEFGQFGANFNLTRDTFYKQMAVAAEMKKEMRRAAQSGVGMNVGSRVFTPEEIAEVAKSGDKMFEAIRTVIFETNAAGDPAFMRDMISRAGDAVYSWNNMTPFQRRYMARFIPFSGWQLFTTGLLWKLPTKYPGRAWLMRSLGQMGQNYVRDLWREQGVDPDTVPDWERFSVPLYTTPEGKVVAFRTTFSGLYDMLDISDIVQSAFSHPVFKVALETLTGKKVFPDIAPLTESPLQRGGQPGRRSWADMGLEMMFGSAYSLANRMAHPYYQYETGGLTNPQPYIGRTGERITYDWRQELLPYTTGVTMRDFEAHNMADKVRSQTRTSVENAFTGLEALIAEEWRTRGASENQRRIIGASEEYLKRSYLYLDQIEEMLDMGGDRKDRRQLISDRGMIMRQIHRIENIRTGLLLHPDTLISPYKIHGQGWGSSIEQVKE